jgi:hypothetical protein
MSNFATAIGLVVAGMLLSTAVFELSKRLQSNDPFAIELACWWIFTDLVLVTKLRGWKMQSAIAIVRENPDAVLATLVAVGLLVVLTCVVLSRTDANGRFAVWDDMADGGVIAYALRSNLARSVVSMYCSLHLALFLA